MSVRRLATAAAVSSVAEGLYAGASWRVRLLARLRPWIMCFEGLLPWVPVGATVLDIGCGAGLFLGLLAADGRVRHGVGLDADARSIRSAQAMATNLKARGDCLRFIHANAEDDWPPGPFSVIALIDVMHHIDPAHQLALVERACSAVPPGGILLYKDMAQRPRWRALANRLHDLVLARAWIHYRDLDAVELVTRRHGLTRLVRASHARWWYQHDLAVYARPHP